MSPSKRPCKDCVAEGLPLTREAKFPGPRCATHWRTENQRRKLAEHARRIASGFGITGEQYWALYEYQNGLCPICLKAKGIARRLAVDHDHRKEGCEHPPEVGCPNCIRGLLCSMCNELIGRYPLAALRRAIAYCEDPPAQASGILTTPHTTSVP